MDAPHLHVFPDSASLVRAVAERIVLAARAACADGQMLGLFLSGGSTPKALYELLASSDFITRIDWRAVELYFGDERCVPPDDERSNYLMARRSLIDRVPIPPDNIYRMKGELAPEQAAIEYGRMLKQRFQDQGPDILLLGMGDDGHTASLFPGTSALGESEHRCVANHVPYDYIPAGTSWRLTLTYPFINRSREVIVMITGASKSERLAEVLEGDDDPARLPIQGVQPQGGNLHYYLDSAAAGMTSED